MYFIIFSLKESVVERNTIWPCPVFTAPSVHCIWSPGYWDMHDTVVQIAELPFQKDSSFDVKYIYGFV